MKRALCILTAMVILITLTACGASEKDPVIRPIDYKELQHKYLLYCTILTYTWDNAEELKPELFINYYAYYFISNGGEFVPDEKRAIYIPQEDAETMIQSHFDVSTDFLRSGGAYKPEREAYVFYGVISTLYTQITSAEQKGSSLTINYDMLGTTDEVEAQGTVVIEVNDGNHKYISNEVTWFDE